MVEEKDVKAFLDPLDVNKLLWVGKKTPRKLNQLGIKTIGEIVSYDPSILMEKFGILGRQLYLYAQGLDRSEVGLHGAAKSISRNVTFEKDTQDSTLVFRALDKLCKEIYEEVKNNDFLFKTVTITVRYEDFETHTHSKTLTFFTNELAALEKAAHELMQPYLRADRKIRLVATRVSKIVSVEKQKSFFDDQILNTN